MRSLDWSAATILEFRQVPRHNGPSKMQISLVGREKEGESWYIYESMRKHIATLSRIIIERRWIYYILKLGKQFNYANDS